MKIHYRIYLFVRDHFILPILQIAESLIRIIVGRRFRWPSFSLNFMFWELGQEWYQRINKWYWEDKENGS